MKLLHIGCPAWGRTPSSHMVRPLSKRKEVENKKYSLCDETFGGFLPKDLLWTEIKREQRLKYLVPPTNHNHISLASKLYLFTQSLVQIIYPHRDLWLPTLNGGLAFYTIEHIEAIRWGLPNFSLPNGWCPLYFLTTLSPESSTCPCVPDHQHLHIPSSFFNMEEL